MSWKLPDWIYLNRAETIPTLKKRKKAMSWVWCSNASDNKAPVLENVDYLFIAIIPSSTLTQNGSAC